MNIFIVCSKAFYGKVSEIQTLLESMNHQITLPNSFDDPMMEEKLKTKGAYHHASWKAEMLREQSRKVAANDAVLVLNLEKNRIKNYIGGATFLEIYKAFELGKRIYFYNPVPEGILRDELLGMNPIMLDGNLALIGEATDITNQGKVRQQNSN